MKSHRSDAGVGQRSPGGAPSCFDETESDDRDETQRREDREAGEIRAGHALGKSERTGEIKSADTAARADESRHYAEFASETLGQQLEHRAIGHSERAG